MTDATDTIVDKIIKVFHGNDEELIAEVEQFRKDLFVAIKKEATNDEGEHYGGLCFDMSPYTFAYNPYAMSCVLATLQELFYEVEYFPTGYNKNNAVVGMLLSVQWWKKQGKQEQEKKKKKKQDQEWMGTVQP